LKKVLVVYEEYCAQFAGKIKFGLQKIMLKKISASDAAKN
jgi:hypothetical protein